MELTSKDKYRKHGFKLAGLGVRVDIDPESTQVIRFTPEKPGEFIFICDVYCGDGHSEMKGTLVVMDAVRQNQDRQG